MQETVVLTIFDREYKLACPSNQVGELKNAARALDARMRELKLQDKMLTLDRLAVLAALLFAQESLNKDGRYEALSTTLNSELHRMNAQLDTALRG
jgi:cell division protein ZapA